MDTTTVDSEESTDSVWTFAVKEGPPSQTVLRAITEVHEGDPTNMRPLFEVIDTDALDDLFRGPRPGTVTFEYEGYTVTVRENAEVIVSEEPDRRTP